jgi:urea transport system permease protein
MAVMRTIICFAFVLLLGVAWSGNSYAAAFEDTLPKFVTNSLNAKAKAIDALVATGDDRTTAVLQAFVQGNLYWRKSDKKIFIIQKSGSVYVLIDPLTAKEIGQATKRTIKKVRVNNRLRVKIRSVLGSLTLRSKNPADRAKAADALFKSRAASSQPLLEHAIARESDAAAKSRMEVALAAIQLTTASEPKTRLAALKRLSSDASPRIRSLLAHAVKAEKDAGVKKAASDALAEVEESLAFWNGIQNIFQGISLGSILLLAAVGLAVTFGVMGVINMAHGELVMIGAYTTFVVQQIFQAYFPGALDYSLIVSIPAAFLVAGLFGIAIERGIIRFLYGRPLETLLATWGLSLVLQQMARSIFGPTNQEVTTPTWMSGPLEITGGLVLTYNRIWIIVFSLLVLGILMLVLKKTSFGLQMRAVTQNRAMASSMGIRTGYVDALTFGLGSGIAGIAGVALSQIDNVSPNLGQNYIIDSFMVVVFGGVGNLWGTLVGAFSLGIANKFMEPFAGTVLAKIFILVVIILFIQKRPRGLFALKGRSVES